jgi:putative DNA primase/helicase
MLDTGKTSDTPEVQLITKGGYYASDQLQNVFSHIVAPKGKQPKQGCSPSVTSKIDDQDVKLAVEHFAAREPVLWENKWLDCKDAIKGTHRFPSQSEADHYLAREIALYGANRGFTGAELKGFVEHVFDHSGLAQRDKWIDRKDYRKRTVMGACKGVVASVAVTSQISVVKMATPDWCLKGDVRAARYMGKLYKGRLIYVRSIKKWLRWCASTERWLWCDLGEEVAMITKGVVQLYVLACQEAQLIDADAGKRLIGETVSLQTEHRIRAVLKLLQSLKGISIKAGDLDNHPDLLGVNNGVVDLTTGQLRQNKQELYITKHIKVNFEPEARAPQWEKFLAEIFLDDMATIDACHRLVGRTLAGSSLDEFMIFCVGTGANGKSIFNNVLYHILGVYAVTAPPSVLATRRTDDHGPRSDLAMMAGSRLVTINELPGGLTLDENVVKQLAGREPISARFLHQEFFTFEPTFSVWVRTNHKPIVKGTDNGIWRRIVILPFRRTFTDDEQDPKLETKLRTEREGILAWMVRGAQAYLKNGVKISQSMTSEVAQYRTDSDILGDFLGDVTEPGTEYEEKQADLFVRFGMWCEANGFKCPTKRSFTAQLGDRGYGQRKSGRDRYYTGLKIESGMRYG